MFEDYPSDLGMSLSRYKSYRMEMHYDNPDLKNDLRDNSGGQFMVDMQILSLQTPLTPWRDLGIVTVDKTTASGTPCFSAS